MTSHASNVEEYLNSLPDDRRQAMEAVRKTILDNLPEGYEEGMQYGGIGYFVPHSIFPAGYHCDPKQPLPFMSIASQKNYMAVHLFCVYLSPEAKDKFVEAYKATGKKLDMGAACVRFKKLDDLPLDLLGKTIADIPVQKFIDTYQSILANRKK